MRRTLRTWPCATNRDIGPNRDERRLHLDSLTMALVRSQFPDQETYPRLPHRRPRWVVPLAIALTALVTALISWLLLAPKRPFDVVSAAPKGLFFYGLVQDQD